MCVDLEKPGFIAFQVHRSRCIQIQSLDVSGFSHKLNRKLALEVAVGQNAEPRPFLPHFVLLEFLPYVLDLDFGFNSAKSEVGPDLLDSGAARVLASVEVSLELGGAKSEIGKEHDSIIVVHVTAQINKQEFFLLGVEQDVQLSLLEELDKVVRSHYPESVGHG